MPFCLSTMSICSIEDVRSAVQKPFWFQVYLMRDRSFNAELLDRALAANCSAIMLTVDMPVQGLRRRDPKNGLSIPPKLTLKNMFEVAMRPTWALKVLTGRRRTFGNLEARMKGTGGLKTLSEWIAQQFDPTVTWKDLAWLRERWPRKIIIKGILDPEDAKLACRARRGCDGGVQPRRTSARRRSLDHLGAAWQSSMPSPAAAKCCSTAVCAPDRTCSRRSRSGAKGCLIGKAFLYALAARGEAGVSLALDIIRKELAVSLALTGANDVRNVTRDVLVTPGD